jgi:hypothetical protein
MLVWLANQRLIRFRQRKRRKIGAYRHHLKSRPPLTTIQPEASRHRDAPGTPRSRRGPN